MAFRPVHNSKFDNVIFGDLSFEGSQEGEYLNISPQADLFNSTLDATGDNSSISINNDYRADVMLRLQRQSPLNIALTDIVRQQQDEGIFTTRDMTFTNSTTLHMYELRDCAIKRLPTEATSASGDSPLDPVEWTFECSRMVPRILTEAEFGVEIATKLGNDVDLTISGSVTFSG